MSKNSNGIIDNILSCISYLTAGWGGLIALILFSIRKKTVSPFLRFNAMQSIFIALLFFCISFGCELIAKFLSFIPFINYLVAQITFLLNRPIFFSWSLVQAFTLGITAYCAIFALIGKYPRIYAISKLIDHNS